MCIVCSVYPGTRSVSCRKSWGPCANKAACTWPSGRHLIGYCIQRHHWTSDSISKSQVKRNSVFANCDYEHHQIPILDIPFYNSLFYQELRT